jgi:hypothetical protein
LSTYFKDTWDLGAEGMQDWFGLDEGDSRFQLQTEEEIVAVTFFIYFHEHYVYFLSFFCILGLSFALLIRMISPQLIWISEGVLYFRTLKSNRTQAHMC